MGNSLPFPKLINFSTCWQIFTWTGWSLRDECVNQQQVGSGICLAQLLFVQSLFFLVIAVQRLSLSRTAGFLSSRGLESHGVASVS